ncbi:hypothetical protein E1286_36125 [Nonomuraea terrae]|uniref:DUF3592 domain-containing protein n=1 Tax=Nonomuraea terrae TaxID=2530383 RepID=A0A4R4Y2M5_9ACTN|nr:hypothetical protein [Nonomuraea terrae]TDD38591.1 hypothetical protein E1286_36125 [Nonomuraea terrae]
MRYRHHLAAALFAVGAPLLGLLVVVGGTALKAFGPEALMGDGLVRLLVDLVVFFAGYGVVLFTQLRYFNVLVFFGAFFTLFIGINGIATSVEQQVLRQRGEITACTVRDVERREWTSTDSQGHPTTHVAYDYGLACADPRVERMTTGSRVAERGERIDVAHDPAARLEPRPAASAGDPGSSLRQGVMLFAIGVVLRLLSEMGVPPFRGAESLHGWSRRFRRRRRS